VEELLSEQEELQSVNEELQSVNEELTTGMANYCFFFFFFVAKHALYHLTDPCKQ
jgi:hypothetical protein